MGLHAALASGSEREPAISTMGDGWRRHGGTMVAPVWCASGSMRRCYRSTGAQPGHLEPIPGVPVLPERGVGAAPGIPVH